MVTYLGHGYLHFPQIKQHKDNAVVSLDVHSAHLGATQLQDKTTI